VPIFVPMRALLRVLLLGLVLVAALSVVGCDVVDPGTDPHKDLMKDPKFVALKREKMATFRPPGGRIVLSSQLREGSSFGKPNDAQITRVFAYSDVKRARRGRQAAIDAAVASGWKLTFEREDPDELRADRREGLVFGGKTLSTGGITLIIGAYEDEGVHRVSISLEHQKCGKGRCY